LWITSRFYQQNTGACQQWVFCPPLSLLPTPLALRCDVQTMLITKKDNHNFTACCQVDNIWAVMIVWRIRWKIIRTALCCYCAHSCEHSLRWTLACCFSEAKAFFPGESNKLGEWLSDCDWVRNFCPRSSSAVGWHDRNKIWHTGSRQAEDDAWTLNTRAHAEKVRNTTLDGEK